MMCASTVERPTSMTEMTVTIQENLKEETLNLIEELKENSFFEEDMYEFITEHGEDNFVQYYETYVELGESYCYEAVDAFIDEFDVSQIDYFSDSYQGHYDNPGDFAKELVEDCYSFELPGFVEIDWESTWNNLNEDYSYNNGFIFSNCF